MVRNVHERLVAAPPEQVGAVMDTLGSSADRMWPQPPLTPMVLRHADGTGLAPGARGGHGGIRYSVEEYEPGRRVVFRFSPRLPINGTHAVYVDEAPAGSLLRHELVGQPTGVMRLLWPLAVRSMHDCYVEDAFDRTERELGVGPAEPHKHSLLVRVFESRLRRRVRSTDPVVDGLGADALPTLGWADAFATDLLPGDGCDPVAWSEAVFSALPPWVRALMAVRHAVMRPFGVRTPDVDNDASFPVLQSSPSEVLQGLDDRHLDFRVVTTVDPVQRRVTMTTLVFVHSRLGRVYWSVVRPIHPYVVRSLMRRTAHPAGFSAATTAADLAAGRGQKVIAKGTSPEAMSVPDA